VVVEQFGRLFGAEPVVNGLVGGLVIAGLNLFGASLVFVWRDPSERSMDGALGFAAGAMLFVISDEIVSETPPAATNGSRLSARSSGRS